jgi:hypothetical protein
MFYLLLLQNCSQNKSLESQMEYSASGYYTVDDFRLVEKIDAHVHLREKIDTVFLKQAEEDNFRLLNVNVYTGSGMPIEEQQQIAIRKAEAFPGRTAYATAFSIQNWVSKDWEKQTLAYLENSFSKGAVAVKVWKNIGLELRDKNGDFVMIDNPRFDTIFNYLAEKKITLIGHLGEPRNTWLPIEKMTVKGDKDYFKDHPQYHMHLHPDYPSYEDQIRARDNMLEKHPDLLFVGAHLGSLEWSVEELAKRLDKYPNMAVDMAERISHLQYQALTDWQKVHDFLIKYQDRLLYGTDLRISASDIIAKELKDPADVRQHAHEVWLRHWRFFTTDDMMRVPKVEGEFKGMKLPKEVIDKIYRKNAEKWFPAMFENNTLTLKAKNENR